MRRRQVGGADPPWFGGAIGVQLLDVPVGAATAQVPARRPGLPGRVRRALPVAFTELAKPSDSRGRRSAVPAERIMQRHPPERSDQPRLKVRPVRRPDAATAPAYLHRTRRRLAVCGAGTCAGGGGTPLCAATAMSEGPARLPTTVRWPWPWHARPGRDVEGRNLRRASWSGSTRPRRWTPTGRSARSGTRCGCARRTADRRQDPPAP